MMKNLYLSILTVFLGTIYTIGNIFNPRQKKLNDRKV